MVKCSRDGMQNGKCRKMQKKIVFFSCREFFREKAWGGFFLYVSKGINSRKFDNDLCMGSDSLEDIKL